MSTTRLEYVAAVCILAVLASSCFPVSESRQSAGGLQSEISPQGENRRLTAKQAYPIAKATALAWRRDAYLELVQMTLPSSEIELGARRIAYRFWSDHSLGPIHWSDGALVTVDTYAGTVVQFDEYRWSTSRQRFGHFDIDAVKLDSSDALALSETAGGREYRTQYPDASVRIQGTAGLYQGELIWSIGYFRPSERLGNELGFAVEARTGEVRGGVRK